MSDALTALSRAGVSIWLDDLSRERLTSGSLADLAAPQSGQQMLTAASYAMSLFHMLAAEFEAACPDVDVQAFPRRRALELVAKEEEAA